MTNDANSLEPGAATRIAVVEDDPEIRDLVVAYLGREGFEVRGFPDGAAFDHARAAFGPALVVLDLMMPGEDGLSICRRVAPDTPVLVLSAKGEEVDRIVGLEVGADDYLAKPFNPRELVARIRAILRRRSPAATSAAARSAAEPRNAPLDAGAPREILRFEGWTLDVDGRRLCDPSGAETPLSSGELALLTEFVRRPRRVLSRDQLLDWTRGRTAEAFDRAIDVQLSRLRRKMAAAGGGGFIKTIRGDGYLFAADVARVGPPDLEGRRS
ncbi:MAG: response regulator [Pseudomonadota bacterium]